VLVDRDAREFAWRVALFGGVITACAQFAMGAGSTNPAPVVASATAPANSDANANARSTQAPTDLAVIASAPGTRTNASAAAPEIAFARHDAPASVLANQTRVVIPAGVPSGIVALAWLAAAGAGLLLIALRLALLRRRFAALPECHDEAIAEELRRLSQRAGVAAPRTLVTSGGESPMALVPNVLCLPQWSVRDLDAQQRRAMLAHEVAHFRRGDPWWQLAYQAYSHVMFFQPLHRLALRRLDQLAELACDDWARRAVDGRALAECLAACAERVVTRSPALALAMAKPRSPLIQRIQTLLEDAPMSHPIRTWVARIALAIVLPSLLLLPVLAIEHVAFAGTRSHNSISIIDTGFGQRFEAELDNGEGKLEVKFKGDFGFSDDEDDVTRLDGSGYIEEELAGTKRRVEFAKDGGGIKRTYSVNGKEQAFGPEAREFLKRVLPFVMRESGYDAEHRVARIKAKGGVDAVLAEIEMIKGDYAARVYVTALSKDSQLSQPQLDRLLKRVEHLNGDYERRVALTSLIENQDMGAPSAQAAVLRAVASMGGDYEQREVLIALAPKLLSDPDTVAAWGKAVSTVDSDYEARVAVTALAERKDLDPVLAAAAIASTAKIGSDYEARVALTDFVKYIANAPALGRDYADATSRISSDYERRVALVELVENAKLDLDGYKAVLEATAGIGSDYECRVALQALAERMPGDAQLIEHYRAVARKLGDYERGQAEKALDRFASL
jgi:beta-lactamase regulating signal transducer with metallopeptidase domain/uncharacterized protein YeeX (DUF496 family)